MTVIALWVALELLVAAVAVGDPGGWPPVHVAIQAAPLTLIIAAGLAGRIRRPRRETT